MGEKRPNVFNVKETINTAQPINTTLITVQVPLATETTSVPIDSDYEAKRLQAANEVYENSTNTDSEIHGLKDSGINAIEQMRKRTEEQMKLRDDRLKSVELLTQEYTKKTDAILDKKAEPIAQKVMLPTELKSPINNLNVSNLTMNTNSEYLERLSQPDFNSPFDVIPLPSEGKLYKNKKSSVRVSYLTTADENILSSGNLLESGEFLEILINRKLLEPDLRYKELHVGDRNAIMLWLRATSYGEMYPVTLLDEDGEPFDTEIDLTKLTIKKLGMEPDDDGLFTIVLPVSKNTLRVKLLTVGDVEEIERLVQLDKENKVPVNNLGTYTLEKHIVSVNGDTNRDNIRKIADNLRIGDGKALRDFINKVECGVNLQISVRTPRGGSIETFLPLNLKFFWPNLTI